MKKFFISLLFCFTLIFSISFAEGVEVRVNYGKFNLPVDPVISNDRTMVPLKAIAEVFGADVTWDPKKIVTINYENNEIILPIGSTRVIVNNDVFKLDSPAMIKDSYTMVPLKFLSEYLDIEVEWYQDERIVNIVIEDEEVVARAESVSRSYAGRTNYLANKIVVIDAGHGGSETGAYYSNVAEKIINLSIAKYVEKDLANYGVKVYMTRSSDTTTTLASRADLANSIGADLFISIHSNAIVGKPYINGTEVLYKDNGVETDGITNKMLATNLLNAVTAKAGTYSKGIINRTNLYVLNRTNMPAALVEVGYMTNAQDMANLINSSFQKKVAEGISDGIIKTLQMQR